MNKGAELEALIARIKPDLKIATDSKSTYASAFAAIDRATDLLSLQVVSDMIAALEQAQFEREDLRRRLNYNPGWDMIDACWESWREVSQELKAAQQRIAELEARPLSVKLPARKVAADYTDGVFTNVELAMIYNTCRLECSVRIKNAGGQVEDEQ